MLQKIIQYSIRHKLIILLFSAGIIGFGLYSLANIPIGAVPDITNNQVQIITTSRNLATEDVEKFLTYPVELEMANLPEVKEIRSVSKFGLSVVTVVFNDAIGTYLPRQLIAEKIKLAEEKIPKGFGTPFMGPITTGLGEIYQYVIDVDPEYRDKYSLSDIRTIQDWQIKRQLSGIPGVVEVNTWGGFLKQYEVAVNPEKLRSLHISLSEIYNALENNNTLAGGGYIEKTNQTYFIRGEGLISSLEDIENTVVELRSGIPILMKDVAKVGFGKATRFGAITGNGEGEKVLGQVMMLKDANSKEVIEAVKKRVAEIATTLPPGIHINPFLERSELIAKTTFTIAENLILGCLIVIFVVVLLLGNIRSGLVVASVIPMCLLFALSLMYIFHVDANLMSLGAIDFGIIIDGAVIIVEYIAFKITAEHVKIKSLPKAEQQSFIDTITVNGASKMMHSAVFGQLIIIIVFIPILSLVGVEGKMFQPMALVFCFALLGAMLLCFTYVPVMASIFIKPTDTSKKNSSTKLIQFLEKKYEPTLIWVLQKKKLVLSLAAGLLVLVALLFTQMGGEFVPTLDEGDFVIQPVLKTGTTLSKTVDMTTNMERILKKFPEVDQVVSRIGAAEVPTDPMSMEESDVIIKLKPRSEWTSAKNKDELADKFKIALAEIPGIDFEFTQPIEMRFNELITGVRADIAIKVFGEDLAILHEKAVEIEKAIAHIEGAADIIVEKISGLPQMSVKYNREKIAKYGLSIQDVNDLIEIGFAGKSAGTVFEGEKQFDLVVRFDKNHHKELYDLANASLQLPNGNQVPLSELATISYTKGPAKISRDNTKRRIVIGVNVRNRDLESVVNEIQTTLQNKIQLPTGYTLEYGGQFENLKTAKERLMVAVPIALLLIFILLYFAFDSVKDALIIYSAIPLSAVGGILLLYMRGLPFSISAGVGFIALFGIAVLNGIVLIEEFKELKAKGMMEIQQRILTGTKNRLRPVLLTATAAALGFLPMAISTSAGAEVQKPLATVVVGGLISATLLTLIVIPVLYALFDRKRNFKKRNKALTSILFMGLLGGTIATTSAQKTPISVEKAIEIAFANNLDLKMAHQKTVQSKQMIGNAIDLPKTEIYINKDENNIAPNNLPLTVWGVSQNIEFPTIYGTKHRIATLKNTLTENEFDLKKIQLEKKVRALYDKIIYQQKLLQNEIYLDSIYGSFAASATKKFQQGESNYLEKLTADAKQKEISLHRNQTEAEIEKSYIEFHQLIQDSSVCISSKENLVPLKLKPLDTLKHPGIQLYSKAVLLANKQVSLAQQQLLPDVNIAVFKGNNSGDQNYNGFQAGIAIPLWFGSQNAKIKASKTDKNTVEIASENYKSQLISTYNGYVSDLKSLQENRDYYETTGKKLAKEIWVHATKAYQNGAIDFFQYTQLLENSKSIEFNFLTSLFNYNKTVLEANYLINYEK